MNPAATHWGWWYGARATSRSVLHFVREAESTRWYRRVVDGLGSATVTAACGRRAAYCAAGIFSRMSRPRCAGCCRALGIARGNGTPRNEAGEKARMA